MTIASLIPPVFAAYAIVVDQWGDQVDDPLAGFDRTSGRRDTPDGAWLAPEHEDLRQASEGWQVQERLVHTLSAYGSPYWWLGYLDTGGEDVVFGHIRGVKLYRWPYKLVKAGPLQALRWRLFLPDLMFPEDHTWCLSTGWDDDWTCLGGPHELIERLCQDTVVKARMVTFDQDATPPGHIAI